MTRNTSDMQRIEEALQLAAVVCRKLDTSALCRSRKPCGHPVTLVDRVVNEALLQVLLRGDEGWLSEESPLDSSRLAKRRVWIVDPIDGTNELLTGLPEWCISIALVEQGEAIAGGICNPTTGETFIGSAESGFRCSGRMLQSRSAYIRGEEPVVLASRSEAERGEWEWLTNAPIQVVPVGSIAYKLALVAGGVADATWTFFPRSEWDIAAGVALATSSGGTVRGIDGKPIIFNHVDTRRGGLIALAPSVQKGKMRALEDWLSHLDQSEHVDRGRLLSEMFRACREVRTS